MVQAAVERAKQIKDERKKGTGTDETENTFSPQINTRPSYLNKTTNDSLDMLASTSQKYTSSNDDVFEQPLPGNRSLNISNRNEERENHVRSVPSPTSDALGNEMKRFPQRGTSSSTQSSSMSSKSFRDLPEDTIDTYTSNERHGSLGSRQMQQHQLQQHQLQQQHQQQQQQQQYEQQQMQMGLQRQQPTQSLQSSKQFQSSDVNKQQLVGQSQSQFQHPIAEKYGSHRDIQESSLSRSARHEFESPRPLSSSASASALNRPLSSSQRPSSSYSRHSGIEENLLYGNDALQQNILQGNVLHGNLISPRAGQHQIDLVSPRNGSYGSTFSGSSGNILSGGSSTGNIPRDILEAIGVGDFESRLRQDTSYTSSSGPGWNDDVSVLTGYKSPGIGTHRQTGVLSSSSSAHQIGGTSTSTTQHTNSSTYAKLGTGTLSGIGNVNGNGNGRKMSAPVTSTSTLPEWNNCSDICDDVALDFSSRTSPRSKSDFNDDSGGGGVRKMNKEGSNVSQARSRLSLLKSKMRRSESGGGARGSKLEWADSPGLTGDKNNYTVSSQAPKSAPHGRRNSDLSSTISGSPDLNPIPKGTKKPFSLTSGDMRSQIHINQNTNTNTNTNTNNRFSDYDDDIKNYGNGNINGSGNGNGNRNKNQNSSKSVILSRGFGSEYPDGYVPSDDIEQYEDQNKDKNEDRNKGRDSVKYPQRKSSSSSSRTINGNGNGQGQGQGERQGRGSVNSGVRETAPSSSSLSSSSSLASAPPSSSSSRNVPSNGFKYDDNRKYDRNSNDEYDDDDDFNNDNNDDNGKYNNDNNNNNNSRKNNNNNMNMNKSYDKNININNINSNDNNNRDNKQNNRKSDMFSDNSDMYTNSRSNTVIEDNTDLGELRECPNCSRKFNPKPYEKHILVCAKINAKRKVFDSLKMRIDGNPELVQILNKKMKEENKKKINDNRKNSKMGGERGGERGSGGGGGGERGELGGQTFRPGQVQEYEGYSRDRERGREGERRGSERGGDRDRDRGGGGDRDRDRDGGMQAELAAAAASSKKSKWQAESNAFRASMRAARQVTHAIATGAPLPPPIASAPDPSLVQCPHCSRRFNAKAADRHIPVCTNIRAKPTMLKRGLGGGGGVNGTLAATRSITSGANRKGKIM